jgi:hypothetical protein
MKLRTTMISTMWSRTINCILTSGIRRICRRAQIIIDMVHNNVKSINIKGGEN